MDGSMQMFTSNRIEPLELERLPQGSTIIVFETYPHLPHIARNIEVTARIALRYRKVIYCYMLEDQEIDEVCENNRNPIKRLYMYYKLKKRLKILKAEILPRLIEMYENIEVITKPERNHRIKHDIELNLSESVLDLKKVCFEGTNEMGISIASNLISLAKNSRVRPSEYINKIRNFANKYVCDYSFCIECLERYKPTVSIVFNGRFSSSKAVIQACRKKDIDIYFHESTANINRFAISRYQPHDRVALQKQMLAFWERAQQEKSKAQLIEISSNYFKELRFPEAGKQTFTSKQKSNEALEVIRKMQREYKTIVTFFTTSEDELASLGDVYSVSIHEWSTQKEAIYIVADICQKLGFGLIVRVHPNVSNKCTSEKRSWDNMNLGFKNTNVIKSSSKVSSYTLMEESKLIVTYGSTIGIESVFWGKPSITMFDSYYDEIGATIYHAKTIREVMCYIKSCDMLEVDKESSFPFAYYKAEFGTHYQMYEPHDEYDGKIMGKMLK